MRAVVIQSDGAESIVYTDATLQALQALVGGYIESVGLKCPTPATAYVNEDGGDLLPNRRATEIAQVPPGTVITGTMVILGAPDKEGDDTPVSEDVLSWLGVSDVH